MNKIFKTIWDAETRQVVVVSELAKSKGKTKSSAGGALKATVLAVAATAGIGAMQNVDAAMAVGGAAGSGTVTIGAPTNSGGNPGTLSTGSTKVTGSGKGMAIGENATVYYVHATNAGLMNNANAMAIGTNATANNTDRSVVIGSDATAQDINAVVIGNNATAIKTGTSDLKLRPVTVIGMNALVRNVNTIDGKNVQSIGATAIGGNALAGLLTPAGATAGTEVSLTDNDYKTDSGELAAGRLLYRAGVIDTSGATVAKLQSNEATAIGVDSRAIGDQSIAIGAQVVAGHSSVAIGGNDMGTIAGDNTNDAVSVANRVTYKDITGADLASNQNGPWYETTYAKDGSVAIGQKAHANELFSTAIGTSSFVEAGAQLGTAIGTGARVGAQTLNSDANLTATANFTTKGGVAIAAGAVAERDYTTAIGTGAKANQTSATAMGYQALASGVNATAVGAKAVATAADALAYGGNATSYATNAVAVGTNSTVVAGADSSIAFGTDTSVSGVKTVALGSNIKNVSTAGSVVLGDSSTGVVGAVGASHAVGTVPNAVITSNNGATITYGGFAGQPLDEGKYVSIGAPKAERQLKNVAAGNIDANSTDGINGSQLYSIAVTLGDQVFQSTYFHTNNITNAGTGNSTTNLGNITDAAGATGQYAVTAGVNATASGGDSVAIGHNANASTYPSIAIGGNATAVGQVKISTFTRRDGTSVDAGSAIAIGNASTAAASSVALGEGADASNAQFAVAVGTDARALGDRSTAVGQNSKAIGDVTLAMGHAANASSLQDTAIGTFTRASGGYSTAVGSNVSASGNASTAIGSLANATANGSVALGKEAGATGVQAAALTSYAKANGKDSIAAGVRATTTADALRGVAIARESSVSATDGIAIGYKSSVTAANATTLGANTVASHKDAAAIGSGAITREATQETQATVGPMTYGNFSGNNPIAVVSFGKEGAERQLVNVAAGNISANSTDAINGSQLYAVAASPITFTANTLADTDADGSQQQLGSTIAIIGSKTAQPLKEDTTNATTAGNYSAKNIQTVVTDNQIQIQMAENPEFTSVVVKNGAGDTNPVTITSGADGTGGTISNLTTTLPDPSTVNGGKSGVAPTNPVTTNAATLGDVLNAGWNLQENDGARDVVTPYDTVNFINGTGTTVNITTTDNVSVVKVDVNTSALVGSVTNGTTNGNGTTTVVEGDGDKLVNITTLANAINASGWNVTSGKTGTGVVNNTTSELINPGETVTFQAGDNMVLTQAGNVFTYAVSATPVFTNVTIGGDAANGTAPITIGTTTDGKNVIGNLTTTIEAPTTVATTPKPTGDALNNAATLGDVLNAGWNLQENGNARDVVTPYDTVNFINGTGTTVNITTTDNVSVVRIDMNTSALAGDIIINDNGTVSNGTTNGGGSALANISTVVDAINKSGWNATSGATGTGVVNNTTSELINPGETVTFQAGDNMVLNQAGNVFTYSVSPTPVFTNVTAKEGITLGDPTGTGPVVEMKPVTATTPVDAAGNTNAPVNAVDMGGATFTNLAPNLPETTSNTTAPTTSKAAPVVTDAQKTNAATLGDVLNAGWNLQGNGEAKDFVKPYDTVNFVNGEGTVAEVTSDGNVSNVTYNVAVDNKTTEITYTNAAGQTLYKQPDGTYNTSRDGSGTTVAAGDITGSQVSAIVPSTSVNGDTVTGPVNLINGDTTTVTNTGNGIKVEVNTGTSGVGSTGTATAVTDKNGNPLTATTDAAGNVTYTDASGKPVAAADVVDNSAKVATVGDIVNTINNVSWNVNSTAVGTGKIVDGSTTTPTPVKAGNTVSINAGNNIEITRDGQNVTVATSMTPTFNTVQVGGSTGPVIGADQEGNVRVGSPTGEPVRITNVAPGKNPTDAVNVSQLKGYVGGAINALDKDLSAGVAGAMAGGNLYHATLPGKSMVSAGAATYRGQSAFAVGYSRLSDNGKYGIKVQVNTNTRGDTGAAASVGYQW